MKSSLIKDLLIGFKITSAVISMITGAIEERKPQKAKPTKPKGKTKGLTAGSTSK
jgi:hypothetical protein